MIFQLVVIAAAVIVILAPALVPSSRLRLFLVDFANFVNDARVKWMRSVVVVLPASMWAI